MGLDYYPSLEARTSELHQKFTECCNRTDVAKMLFPWGGLGGSLENSGQERVH